MATTMATSSTTAFEFAPTPPHSAGSDNGAAELPSSSASIPMDHSDLGADPVPAAQDAAAALDTGTDRAYEARLARKVQQQARELSEMHKELEEKRAYITLCERRVVELVPNHRVPLDPGCLGAPPMGVTQPASPTRRVPSQYVAANAAKNREISELARRASRLERQLRQSDAKLREAQLKLREARQRAQRHGARTGEGKAAHHELVRLRAQVNTLKGQLSVAESAVSVASSAPAAGGADEQRRLQARRQQQAEQQEYISVLEEALKLKVDEIGLVTPRSGASGNDELEGEPLLELVRLRRAAERNTVDLQARDNQIRQLQRALEEQRADADAQRTSYAAMQKQLSESAAATQASGQKMAQLDSEKNALLEYVQDTVDKVQELEAAGKEARAERSALRDAMTEAKDLAQERGVRVESLEKELSALREGRADAEAAHAAVEEQLVKEREARDALDKQLRSKSEEADEMSHLVEDCTRQSAEHHNELQKLRLAHAQLEAAHDTLKAQEQTASSALAEHRTDLASAQESLNDMRMQVDTLRTSNEALELRSSRLDELQAAEATRDQECAAMRSETDQTRAELQRLRQFEALCKQLEAEMSTARRIDDEMLAKSQASADGTNAVTNADTNADADAETGAGAPQAAALLPRMWCSNPSLKQALPTVSLMVQRLDAQLNEALAQAREHAKGAQLERQEKEFQRKLLHDEIQSLRQQETAAQERHQEDGAALAESRAELARTQAKLESVRGELQASETRGEMQQKESSERQARHDVAVARIAELENAASEAHLVALELQEVRHQLQDVTSRKNELDNTIQELRERLTEQDGTARQSQAQTALLEERIAQERTQREAAERSAARLSERIEVLEQSEVKLAVESREVALLRQQLESAAELAERQNALCVSLEARLGALNGERTGAVEEQMRAAEALAEARYLAEAAFRQVVDAHPFVREINRELEATFGSHNADADLQASSSGAPSSGAVKRSIHRIAQLLGAVSAAGASDHSSLNAVLQQLESMRAQLRDEDPRDLGDSACVETLVTELRDAVQLLAQKQRQAASEADSARAASAKLQEEIEATRQKLSAALAERQSSMEQLAETEAELGALRSTTAGDRAMAEIREREREQLQGDRAKSASELAKVEAQLAAEQEQGKKRRTEMANLMKKTVVLEAELGRYKQQSATEVAGASIVAPSTAALHNMSASTLHASALNTSVANSVQAPMSPSHHGTASLSLPAANASASAMDLQERMRRVQEQFASLRS